MDFIIELRDSDGNDCSVSDILVSAPDADAAMDAALDWATETLGGEPDGDSGAYYDCDCAGEEPACDGHGGWMLGTPEPMPPAKPAYYHRKIDIR